MLRMDNGPECISAARQAFCSGSVGISYIPTGHPVEERVHLVVQQAAAMSIRTAPVGPPSSRPT